MADRSPVALLCGTGRVTAFDDAAGWGTVVDDDGTERTFHCTAVTDGTRTIDPGTRVGYRVVPGRNGHWEATEVRPVG